MLDNQTKMLDRLHSFLITLEDLHGVQVYFKPQGVG